MIIKAPIAYVKLDKQGDIFDKRALISMAKNTKLPIYIYTPPRKQQFTKTKSDKKSDSKG